MVTQKTGAEVAVYVSDIRKLIDEMLADKSSGFTLTSIHLSPEHSDELDELDLARGFYEIIGAFRRNDINWLDSYPPRSVG